MEDKKIAPKKEGGIPAFIADLKDPNSDIHEVLRKAYYEALNAEMDEARNQATM